MKARSLGRQIKPATWQTWLAQWAELLQAGMPALDALALSCELQTNALQGKMMRAGLRRTFQFLHEGQNLQTAFRASFGSIPLHLEISLLCAQASGDLGAALQVQLDRWKTTSDAQLALGKSLIYPLLVLVLAVACWILLHHVSAPHLAQTNANAEGAFKWSDGLLVVGALILPVAWFGKIQQSRTQQAGRVWLPKNAWITSDFYHVIACELHAGLDLLHSLRHRTMPIEKWAFGINLLGLNSSDKTLRELNQLMLRIQQRVKQGSTLSQAMQEAQAPDFLVRQSQLAEQTGNLAYCFFLAAKVYEMQARETQQRLQSTLPAVALAVAALTLAMAYQFTLAPLYNNLTGLA